MSLPWKKATVGLGIVALAGWAVYIAMRPAVVPVDLVTVVRAPMEVTMAADGVTRIRDVYEVSAPVSGRTLRSPVKTGDVVVAGKTVVAVLLPGEPVFLDSRLRRQAEAGVKEAEAAVQLARSNITAAEANVKFAESQLNRVANLFDRGAVPASSYDNAVLAVDVARAQRESAIARLSVRQSALERMQAMLIEPYSNSLDAATEDCCINLTAPVSGNVLGVVNESQRVVAAGTPLLSVGRLDDLEIAVDLLSSDAVRLKPGARAYIDRWGGVASLQAVVREIEPAAFTKISALGIEEQRVRVLLDFVSPLEQRAELGHDFRVYVRAVEWAGEDVLQVAVSALFRNGEDWAVFVADGDVARIRIVEIGQKNSETAQVLSGLKEGESVVTHPSDRVADGVTILDRNML